MMVLSKAKPLGARVLAPSAICLAAGLLFADALGAEPPSAKKGEAGSGPQLSAQNSKAVSPTDSAERQKRARESLPALLQLALLNNQREHVENLKGLQRLYEVGEEGGDVAPSQITDVEEELLQARITLLQREADYQDALDLLELKLAIGPVALGEVEKALLLPLARQLQEFQNVYQDFDGLCNDLSRYRPLDQVPKLRTELHRVLPSAALLRGTVFRNDFARDWEAWEKLLDEKLRKQLADYREERRRLLDKKAEGRPFSAADQKRQDKLDFEIDLGEFESVLREYLEQPWKTVSNPEKQQEAQQARFRMVANSLMAVLAYVRSQRLESLRQNWPRLPALEFKRENLLTADWKHAVQILTSSFKERNRVVAAKRQLRALLTLQEVYAVQQRLVALAYARFGAARDSFMVPPAPGEGVLREDVSNKLHRLLVSERSLAQNKEQVITMWIKFQIVHLELSHDLGQTPP
jgi:hypothetical protein